MKKKIKKWTFRLLMTGLFIFSLLLIIVLNPILTYASETSHYNSSIFHNKPLDKSFQIQFDKAVHLLKSSELYDPELQFDICLNDGSIYTKLMRTIKGPAFAWGFYNKVVLQGTLNPKENYVELNGYKWNLTQLLAHEMTHCMQFNRLGFWKSKPLANIPNWKWEGYAEYIARQNNDQKDLAANIKRLQDANQHT